LSGYLLDTNIVSELVKAAPDAKLVAWIGSAEEELLFLSVLTIAEIRRGIERLPDGARRARLRRWLDVELADRFEGRILDVGRGVAEQWGVIMARGEAAGRRLPTMDAFFAATAAYHGMTMVTRNARDFATTGVVLVNPWED
jgi:predicted nucleic acid-binding protein